MASKKTLAIVLGTAVGIAAVAITVNAYVHKHHQQPVVQSVGDIVEQARSTVKKLDEAVDMLRKHA